MKLSTSEQSRIHKEIKVGDNKRIVTLNNYDVSGISNIDYVNNVYCVDNENNIIWRIKAPDSLEDRDAFNAFLDENGNVLASRSNGKLYKLDPENGDLAYVKYQR